MTGSEKPFFVCGVPKSGTTFLQRLLNLHPAISCPSEQHLRMLDSGLNAILSEYQKFVVATDLRTGGQGAPAFDEPLKQAVFRSVVETLSRQFAGGKPIHGLNDNAIFTGTPFVDTVFEQPKFVAIFRNPVDCAISTWRHNHRLAHQEPTLAEKHLAPLKNPAGTVEGYAEQMMVGFRRATTSFLDYARGKPNFLIVRYEDLSGSVASVLPAILAFLGAEASPDTVAGMVEGSSREAMARNAKQPGFFGLGPEAGPRVVIDAATRARLEPLWLSPQLAALGYGPQPSG